MKLNECSVAHYATCKGEWNTAYHRRWFIRKGNMLFYSALRKYSEPIGVIVLECCTVMLCKSAEELAFTIKFDCAKVCVYKMAAANQAAMESWMKAVSRASFSKEIQDGPGGGRLIPTAFRRRHNSFQEPLKRVSPLLRSMGAQWAPPLVCRGRGTEMGTMWGDVVRPPSFCFSTFHDWYRK
uniref:PH domain-containing protein n=1 Tax=Oncorhynchus kisutch TaxID=8019 RepID=A0A8C7J312_ONCKI